MDLVLPPLEMMNIYDIWISYDVYWCLRVSSCQELNIVFFLKLKNDAFSLLGAIRRIPLLALSGLRRRPGKKMAVKWFQGFKKKETKIRKPT